jgi:hypothetical protein
VHKLVVYGSHIRVFVYDRHVTVYFSVHDAKIYNQNTVASDRIKSPISAVRMYFGHVIITGAPQ